MATTHATSRSTGRLPSSDVESNEEAGLCQEMNQACVSGNLHNVHTIYQRWSTLQNSNPESIYVRKFRCFASCIILAAENNHSTIVYYFLACQGMAMNKFLSMSAFHTAIPFKALDVLEMMLHEELWDINEPESYCEPGAFRQAAPFFGTVTSPSESYFY